MKAMFLPKALEGIGTRKYVVDYQTGRTKTEPHWHDCIEIVHIRKGRMQIFLNNEWHEMAAGDMVFVPPKRVHYMVCNHDETEKTVIGISRSLICDSEVDGENVLLPFETDRIDNHCFFKDSGELSEIISRLNSADESYVGKLLIQAEILHIYAYIYQEWVSNGLSFTEPIRDKIIFEITQILEKNFAAAPGAYEMSRKLGVSYSYMCRVLNEKLGTSYNALLHSFRIENAKKLLLATDRNITEIGFDCGFNDSSYFIKSFKKSVGTTPKKYRTLGKKTV